MKEAGRRAVLSDSTHTEIIDRLVRMGSGKIVVVRGVSSGLQV